MNDAPFIDSAADIAAIERRPYADVVPAASTFELIDRAARARPDADALIYLASPDPAAAPLRWRYGALVDRIVRAGNLFRSLGIERGDAVALLAPHIPSAQVALWGAQLAGCAFPINNLLSAEHVAALLAAARARVVVTLADNAELAIAPIARQAAARAGCVEHLLEIDPDELAPAPGSFQARLAAQPGQPAFDAALSRDTLAALYHTGGTTGVPKLLRHSHGNEVHTSWFASRFYRFAAGDVMLNGFPLFHVAGAFVYGLSSLAAGGTLLLPTLTGMRNAAFLRQLWRFAEAYGLSHIGCVPTILSALLGVPREGLGTRLRAALTGGSPLPNELAQRFEALHGLPVRNIFGMTECAGIVSIEPLGAPRCAGSTGLRLPYTEVAAVPLGHSGDGSATATLGPDEVGVVAIRGPHVSAGYLDATKNAGTFTTDGWLVSGDLGFVDAAGRIHLTGRSKDLIIRGGHNIDPGMIEEAFLGHPAVASCAAVGEPDGYAGELPVVFVTLKPDARASAEELLAAAAPRIAERPAWPKRVVILDALPLTAIGKIYKPALRLRAAQTKIAELLRGHDASLGFELECREDKGGVAAEIRLSGASEAQREALRSLLAGLPVALTLR